MAQVPRVKLCGLRSIEDVRVAVQAGADAVGLVFYESSPRYVDSKTALAMLAEMPLFMTSVGLFVNASPEQVAALVKAVPVSLLQFHGDESVEDCHRAAAAAGRPYIRAVGIDGKTSGADLLECEARHRKTSNWFRGLLLDAKSELYGGAGKCFDWSVIPPELAGRIVLSGGLDAENVGASIARVQPYAVDVSSGIESARGVKDPARMREFVQAVHKAGLSAS
jgi:phosphoribosylanthranilate isomerase